MGYNFLNQANSGYIHNVVNHNHGIFGLTSKIEGVWGEIRTLIKKMYSCIRSKNFIYFLREAEIQGILRKLMNSLKLQLQLIMTLSRLKKIC